MAIFGVTGGIGSGKSTVLSILSEVGKSVLDADEVVHRLYREDESLRSKLAKRWGNLILDNSNGINRAVVAEIVFNRKDEISWLNSAVHPLVKQEIERFANFEKNRPLYCAVPLLFESGWQDMFELTISVWCPPEAQLQRLSERGWNPKQIKSRLDKQMSMDEKLRRADYGIINSGSLSFLRQQILEMIKVLESTENNLNNINNHKNNE